MLGSWTALSGQQVSGPVSGSSEPGGIAPPKLVSQLSDPVVGGLQLSNASLTDVIDTLAQQLKINYVLDPRVQGAVTLNTYGEATALDPRSLLEAILRINGFGMVQQGELYRIVPINDITHLSISPTQESSATDIPDDDRTILDLVFVNYLSAEELLKVLEPFLGENAKAFTYSPANLILILDSRRNLRRLLDLIALFDNVKFASERVRLFAVKNARPSDLTKELESVVKPLFLAADFAPIVLLPLDRIGAIVAVAKSPSMFPELEKWLHKLDVPGSRVDEVINHVYKVKFGDAKELASSIMSLYGLGDTPAGAAGLRNGTSLSSPLSVPNGVGAASTMPAGVGPGSYGSSSYAGQRNQSPSIALGGPAVPSNVAGVPSNIAGSSDLTGTYMGTADSRGQPRNTPRVVARASNSLMIQALPADYENILSLLRELDVPPRQVLIEARIYEVDLTSSLASSVGGTLQEVAANSIHQFLGNLSGSATNLTIGTLIGRSRELLAAVQLQETHSRAKVISAPSVVATDGIAATMNVGTTVPTLSAQAVTGAQQNGSSLFANSVVNQDSGITLSVLAHVNASGVVTLEISQQVSAPIPPSQTGIQSPSFSNRSIQTQVTLQDGDTIAIGGIIDEQSTYTTSGIPYLNRIPGIGFIFGSRGYNKERTELIMFITPRVIYDTAGITEASEELKDRIKHVGEMVNLEQ